ncbi:hypothetical protein NE237_027123 [Protea cynaroides]|uniref:non-specific serine/threonine protein kinase n=1 Tax=Protea cynaroides TaxID=273540 RepID=A0A9Q0GNQ7_9MAGN|nr:hypothetical protein NE237_027123 [Protea cynaroides]
MSLPILGASPAPVSPPITSPSTNASSSSPPPSTSASSSPPPPPPRNASPPTPVAPSKSPPASPPPSSSSATPPLPSSTPVASFPPPPSTHSYSPPAPSNKFPPPFTRSHYSPPPPPHSSSSSASDGVSTGLVAGIAVGGVVMLVFLSLLCLCCKKKRRRDYQGPGDFYGLSPPRSKDRPSKGQPQHWQHYALPPEDHILSMPPAPSAPPVHASQPLHSPASTPIPPLPPVYASQPPHSPARTPTPPPPPPPFISSSGGSESNHARSENPLPPRLPGIALGFSTSGFTYEELEMATDGFSDANMLGQGGFGYVHKGVLPNGKEVAVKSLKASSVQGDREFQTEVEIISRVHHKHLVSLVGYCIAGSQRMLVYEFVPNNTLQFHLHGKGRPVMDWPTRLKIAVGAAKGLAYLHEDCHPKIVHRDIKADNILLNYKFEAKLADFGLARLISDTNTHVSTRVMGTFGYLAPEYAASGKLTDKSDVFSFGVMLLELITGHQPAGSAHKFMDDNFVDWARPLLARALEDGNYSTLVDPRLQKDYKSTEMACMVACAAACVRHAARQRPRMSQIVRALEGDLSLSNLNEGISTLYGSYASSDYDTIQFNEDMKKFPKMTFNSQEYGSNGYSEPTSKYGLYQSGSSSEGQPTTREMEMGRMKKDRQG